MISKSFRLTRKDFILAKKHGKSHSTKFFSATVYFHTTPVSRFSVVTSTKLSKKAVIRNRLRRQVYDQLSTLNFQLSIDIILYPKSSMLNLTYAQIGAEINSFLSKIHS